MNVDETSLLEEVMDGHCSRTPESEYSGEYPSLGSEVGELSEVLQSVDLTPLERVLLWK